MSHAHIYFNSAAFNKILPMITQKNNNFLNSYFVLCYSSSFTGFVAFQIFQEFNSNRICKSLVITKHSFSWPLRTFHPSQAVVEILVKISNHLKVDVLIAWWAIHTMRVDPLHASCQSAGCLCRQLCAWPNQTNIWLFVVLHCSFITENFHQNYET